MSLCVSLRFKNWLGDRSLDYGNPLKALVLHIESTRATTGPPLHLVSRHPGRSEPTLGLCHPSSISWFCETSANSCTNTAQLPAKMFPTTPLPLFARFLPASSNVLNKPVHGIKKIMHLHLHLHTSNPAACTSTFTVQVQLTHPICAKSFSCLVAGYARSLLGSGRTTNETNAMIMEQN